MEKKKALEVIEEMSEHFELEELIERLIFIEKVEKGLQQVAEGKVTPHEDVKKMSKQW